MATDPNRLYEKCAECHLFVEPNSSRTDEDPEYDATLAEYIHLHRGDEADEALDATHEARSSGMKATLATWKAYGPREMRLRFTDYDVTSSPHVLTTDDGKDFVVTVHGSEKQALDCLRENFAQDDPVSDQDLLQFVCDQGVEVHLFDI